MASRQAALLLFALLFVGTLGHGAIVYPLSRNSIDSDEVNCDRGSDHCSAKATGTGCVNHTHPTEPCKNGQASFWYSQGDVFFASLLPTDRHSLFFFAGCFIGCPECDHKSGRRQTDLCGNGKERTIPDWCVGA